MKTFFSLSYSFFVAILYAALIKGESCSGITYTSSILPREEKREDLCSTKTLFFPRSQGSQLTRYVVGWHNYLPGCDDRAWGSLSLTTEYAHSFNNARIAQYLFGSTQLHFSGSQVPQRNSSDLLADYFGLPTTFTGAIAFNPSIENIVLDINYFLGLDYWLPGLYTRMTLPVVITRWNLGVGCHERNSLSLTEAPTFPAAYMSANTTPAAKSIREALSGNFTFGDMAQPMHFGAFSCGKQKKVGVAEIDFIAGYNFIADECSHLGIYLITAIPTGNFPQNEIIFEPLVGNGRLWEVGPGFSGHLDVIRHDDHVLTFEVNGYLTKQFQKTQIRSFDLYGYGPLSRYILLKEFTSDGVYTGNLIQGIDFCTRSVRVGDSVKGDLVAKLSYYCDRFGVDVGYNLYGRSGEHLRLQDDQFPSDINNKLFGIKGTEGTHYRLINSQTSAVIATNKLNSVQHNATIQTAGTVTNAEPIQTDAGTIARTWNNQGAFQSVPPRFITLDTLDLSSGRIPRQLTHSFFAHVSYTAGDSLWEPQIGLGGKVEVDGYDYVFSSLNQWSIWVKISAAF